MQPETSPKFPPNIDPRIASLVSSSMPALVRPAINPAITRLVPQLVESINNALPGSAAKERSALHAALWLLADDLPTAHTICQDIATPFGSAWHAILHRRDGDFSNSKYWWHRASTITWKAPGITGGRLSQQLIALLANAPAQLAPWRANLAYRYDPNFFVDLVEREFHAPNPAIAPVLLQAQRLEWTSLFIECFHQGTASALAR